MRGIVTDAAGEAVEGAVVRVRERNKDVVTTAGGEYWRLLVPGNYSFQDSLLQFWHRLKLIFTVIQYLKDALNSTSLF